MNTPTKVNTNDYAVIIMSCDSYSDVWEPFSQGWDKFWPNCPFNCYLISETIPFHHKSIKNIQTAKPMRWGEMLLYVLSRIKTENIIYLQEDYILREKVNEKELFDYLAIYESLEAAYLRLLPWPGPDRLHPKFKNIGLLDPNSKYRTSLQASVWKNNILKSLVKPSDDGRFESWSIERAKNIERPFLCILRNGVSDNINHDGPYPIDYYATSVFQGKWLKEALRIYKDLGIKIDTSKRGVMNRIDFLEYHERKKGKRRIKYKLIKKLKWFIEKILKVSRGFCLSIH